MCMHNDALWPRSHSSEAETQVMDYQTQQFKVLPLIATAYAMTVAGRTLYIMHHQYRAEAAHGNFDLLPEVSERRAAPRSEA